MVRKDKQVLAVNLLADLLVCFILHVVRVIGLNTIYYNLFIQLNSKAIFVNGNLLDVITASNFYSCLSHQVLDDDVGHQFSVGISFLVESMNLIQKHFVKLDLTIVSSSEDGVVLWIDGNRPDPVIHITDLAKHNSLTIPEGDLFVTTCHYEVVTLWEEGHAAWVHTELLVLSNSFCRFTALNTVY